MLESLTINDLPYMSLGSDLAEIGDLRLGRFVRLVAVLPDGTTHVLSDGIWSRHPDALPKAPCDDGSPIRTLCQHFVTTRKPPPGTVFAVRVIPPR